MRSKSSTHSKSSMRNESSTRSKGRGDSRLGRPRRRSIVLGMDSISRRRGMERSMEDRKGMEGTSREGMERCRSGIRRRVVLVVLEEEGAWMQYLVFRYLFAGEDARRSVGVRCERKRRDLEQKVRAR